MITETIILDFMLTFRKIHFTEKNLDIGAKRLKLPGTFSTIRNYYRRNQMGKGKDISTMFTREENKKNGRAGCYQADSVKIDIISPAVWSILTEKR